MTNGTAANTPARAARSAMSCASAALIAHGFSMANGMPSAIRKRASSAMSQCLPSANTKSGGDGARTSRGSRQTPGSCALLATSSARPSSGSATPITDTPGIASSGSMVEWRVPMRHTDQSYTHLWPPSECHCEERSAEAIQVTIGTRNPDLHCFLTLRMTNVRTASRSRTMAIQLSENFRALFYAPFYAAHAIGAYRPRVSMWSWCRRSIPRAPRQRSVAVRSM